jgi:minor extracellular serine protease Vpr
MILRHVIFSVTLGTAMFASMPIGTAGIQILAITSSTDFQSAAIAPGSLESIWCTGLTGIQGVMGGTGPILPTQLAGVSVYAGGAANAPILAVADLGGYQLINIQIPWDAGGFNAIAVSQGQEKATATVTGGAQWPVFFAGGAGYLVARHASDYSLVAPDNPARPGEWIVGYASNLGPVANTPPSGAVAPNNPLSPLAPTPGASGVSAPVYSVVIPQPGEQPGTQTEAVDSNFMGLAPGTVGVYQINFRVPDAAPAGDAVVYMRKTVDCGFFFVQGCGRGLTSTFSDSVKLPIGH